MTKYSLPRIGIMALLAANMIACGGGSASSEAGSQNTPGTPSSGSTTDTVPVITLLNTPEALSQEAYAKFEFEAQDASEFSCELDGQLLTECQSPLTLMPLDTGEHSFSLYASNQSGQSSEVVSYQWTIQSLFEESQSSSLNADLIKTTVQPEAAAANSWRGIFRINCDFAHASYNDPIVFPGVENAAHLHRFYGNTLTDHNSSAASLFTEGESSCQGNKLNLSAYWVPALLAPVFDAVSGERLVDEQGEPAWQMVPAVVGNDDEAHEIFYYSAGVDDLDAIQPIPVGLRMIAGNHMAQPGQEQDTSIVRWHCQSWGSDDAANPQFSASIPECVAPDRLRMDIFFPSCWNGTDLDSADHKSHMAYPVSDGGPNGTHCPATHPVPLVRPSYHYAFGIKPEVYEPLSKSSKGWKLAADMYTADQNNAGGISLHGDWFNAWHPEVMQALLDNCIKQGLDCHDGNLANGYRLSGTRPGTQVEPAVAGGGSGF